MNEKALIGVGAAVILLYLSQTGEESGQQSSVSGVQTGGGSFRPEGMSAAEHDRLERQGEVDEPGEAIPV